MEGGVMIPRISDVLIALAIFPGLIVLGGLVEVWL